MPNKVPFFFMTGRQKFLLVMVITGQILSSLLDLVSLGVMAPFLFLVADPGHINRNPLLKTLYDWLGFQDSGSFLTVLGFGLLAFLLFSAVFKVLANQSKLRFTRTLAVKLSSQQFRTVLGLQYQQFEKVGHNRLRFVLLSDLQTSINGVLVPYVDLVSKGTVSAIVLATMLALNPMVILSLGIGFAVFYGVVFFFQRTWLQGLGTQTRNLGQSISRRINDMIGGIRDVKFYGAQKPFLDDMKRLQEELAQNQYKSNLMGTMPRISLETVILGGIVVFLLTNLDSGKLTEMLPMLGVIVVVFFRLSSIFQGIFTAFSKIRSNTPTYNAFRDRVVELSNPNLQEAEHRPGQEVVFQRELQLKGVSFWYEPGVTVLKSIDLTVHKGEWIGIAGTSGSGKSTLADLLCGLLRPTEGQVLVDGTVLTEPEQIWQGGRLAYVSQANVLFDLTIAENIAYGVPKNEIDHERLVQAARDAAIDGYIEESCPQKYDTLLGDSGVSPSGGQRQRLALARALYRRADLLILDEVTSALDGKTEAVVLRTLETLRGKTTIITVAHKPAILEKCDQVLVIDSGIIQDQGSWIDLQRRNPTVQSISGERLDYDK